MNLTFRKLDISDSWVAKLYIDGNVEMTIFAGKRKVAHITMSNLSDRELLDQQERKRERRNENVSQISDWMSTPNYLPGD